MTNREQQYIAGNITKGIQVPVLDKGFVRLVDYMGSDDALLQAARCSYGKGFTGNQSDLMLIAQIVGDNIDVPMQSCVLKLHIRAPIIVSRNFGDIALHTFIDIELPECQDAYMPDIEAISITGKNPTVRGVEGLTNVTNSVQSISGQAITFAEKHGIARQLARINLTMAHYEDYYCTVPLGSVFDFLQLWLKTTEHYEMRQYAEVIAVMASELFPLSWAAFVQYRLESVSFSLSELAVLANLDIAKNKYLAEIAAQILSAEELVQFKAKIAKIEACKEP